MQSAGSVYESAKRFKYAKGSRKERPRPLHLHYFIIYGYCGRLEAIKMERVEGRDTTLGDVRENVDRRTSVPVTGGDGYCGCWSSTGDLLKMGYKFYAQGRLCNKVLISLIGCRG
uniref:Uncharacterized protein n=1 Tax=Ascaris lumbricoides TaxID=6252 RepID=A0A0M3HKY6_ASCLU